MKLYLVRHAAAEPLPPDGQDGARALTPAGRREFRRALRGLERLGLGFERLIHSPARRALETAELLATRLEGEMQVDERLYRAPEASLLDALAGERVALVGHEPWLSELARLLAGAPAPGGLQLHLELEKGGLIELAGEPRPGGMALVQLLAPRTLRRLGRA